MIVQGENIRQDPPRTLPATLEQRWSADIQTLYRMSMRRFSDLDLERVVGRGTTPIVCIFVAQCKKKKKKSYNSTQHSSQYLQLL